MQPGREAEERRELLSRRKPRRRGDGHRDGSAEPLPSGRKNSGRKVGGSGKGRRRDPPCRGLGKEGGGLCLSSAGACPATERCAPGAPRGKVSPPERRRVRRCRRLPSAPGKPPDPAETPSPPALHTWGIPPPAPNPRRRMMRAPGRSPPNPGREPAEPRLSLLRLGAGERRRPRDRPGMPERGQAAAAAPPPPRRVRKGRDRGAAAGPARPGGTLPAAAAAYLHMYCICTK